MATSLHAKDGDGWADSRNQTGDERATATRNADTWASRPPMLNEELESFLPPVGAEHAGALSSIEASRDTSLERQAYNAILEWLVQGHGAPGQPIPLREFARALGMSRTPLRTALGRLQEQGLVDYSPRLGFTATVPSVSDLHQLFEIRLMCEVHAVRRFFERLDRKVPEELPRLARETWDLANQAVMTPESARAFWDRDNRFHRSIVSLGHNRRLTDWWDLLHINIHIARAGLRARMTPSRFQASAEEHLGIAEAMQADDREGTGTLLETHLARIRDQTIRFITSPDERELAPLSSAHPYRDIAGAPRDPRP